MVLNRSDVQASGPGTDPEPARSRRHQRDRTWRRPGPGGIIPAVPRVLLATDADWIHEEVDAAIAGDDIDVLRIRDGVDVLPAVHQLEPDLVVLDLQIGNMGGMAACMGIRLDQSIDTLGTIPVLMLLDRDADVFLAERCEADGWLIKPLDALRLARATAALLAGETFHEHRFHTADSVNA